MRKFSAFLLIFVLLATMVTPTIAASTDIVTPATGYTCAEDVNYITQNNIVVNWGARGEDCTFLTTYAESYYTNSYTWETLSQLTGGTGSNNAPSSELYKALQNMMKGKHRYQTNYGETRYQYCYTDCLLNDYTHISSFYSGKELSGTWDSGKTWNREHTWPNSKGLAGNDENDIMMLRPTWVSENSSRGNKAYGESGGYFDPGAGVRGDCARIVLYVYVRWGNVGKMWGTSGVMESMDVLLKWMEEDPVDTWEMGRNDSVQSITGVRNVFVDYPEYAWLLFGQQIPEDMSTPSGNTTPSEPEQPEQPEQPEEPCAHANTEMRNHKDASCGLSGYTGDTFCTDCGDLVQVGKSISATGKHTYGDWQATADGLYESHKCTVCSFVERREAAEDNTTIIVIAAVAAVVVAAGAVTVVILLKKKKQ